MIQWQKSEVRLNRQAISLRGNLLGFIVHYWGAVHHLAANPIHKHSFFEICYVKGGTGIYTEGERIYQLSEGVLFCSKPGVMHQIKDVNELELLYVAFEPDEKASDAIALASYVESLTFGAVCLEQLSESPLARLWESLLISNPAVGMLSDEVLPSIAHALIASFPATLGTEREPMRETNWSGESLLVQRAKRYIRDNLSGNLSLPDIARYLNVSERHLSRLFNENIKESYTAIVRNERIRAAEELLIRTHTPIKEIAQLVGFASVHYFTRSFAQVKGMPPATYRDAARI
ncbi:AraC family transcriptional regulator [Paenibacillus sp. PL2-23]|uniref:AraC family transcriptional regulator n=1 Tax=Paenibacillus sp. PL2-23 TaxID=2100729 RepID=UPI0030F4EF11